MDIVHWMAQPKQSSMMHFMGNIVRRCTEELEIPNQSVYKIAVLNNLKLSIVRGTFSENGLLNYYEAFRRHNYDQQLHRKQQQHHHQRDDDDADEKEDEQDDNCSHITKHHKKQYLQKSKYGTFSRKNIICQTKIVKQSRLVRSSKSSLCNVSTRGSATVDDVTISLTPPISFSFSSPTLLTSLPLSSTSASDINNSMKLESIPLFSKSKKKQQHQHKPGGNHPGNKPEPARHDANTNNSTNSKNAQQQQQQQQHHNPPPSYQPKTPENKKQRRKSVYQHRPNPKLTPPRKILHAQDENSIIADHNVYVKCHKHPISQLAVSQSNGRFYDQDF